METDDSTALLAARALPMTCPEGALDLRPLEAAIGDARVVLLGEQSHGDGAAFSIKARLVEHLHRHHGFDVLAFEADFYGLHRAWRDACLTGEVTGVARHVYGFWQTGPAVEPLWRFVRERLATDRPLIIAGLDPRHTGSYPRTRPIAELEVFLRAEAIDAPADWDGFSALLADLLEHEYEHRVSSRDRRRFMDALWTLSARIEPRNDEARFWRQELRNLAWTARNAWAFEGRDEGMGCNLVWLANELYPRKRIVVWSHNFHIVRDARVLDPHHLPYAVEREKYRDTPMGEIAARHLGYGLRSIAIVAGQGWYAPYAFNGDHDTRADLCAPPLGGLEDHLLRHGHELAFIDMRDATTGAFTMSGVEHDTPIEAPWHRIYDGVLYLRTMYGPAGIGVARATASAKESAISRRA